MVDVNIKSLISMAQNYAEKAKIDTDKSGTINSSMELNRLLAGTGASCIEDLTADDIRKKMADRDTEKIFTTFMATENHEQVKINKELLMYSTKKIQDTYKQLDNGFNKTSKLLECSAARLDSIRNFLEEGNFGQEAVDKVVESLQDLQMLIHQTIKELTVIKAEYNNTTGQDFPPMQNQIKLLEYASAKLDDQIKTVIKGSVPMGQIMPEIEAGISQIHEAIKDTYDLREQYQEQNSYDMKLLSTLLDQQMKFAADNNIDIADKQAHSRELLNVLVAKASPMTRNFVIQKAEEAYRPENDPGTTAIRQNDAASNIKRSSYKTPTEIYTLKGNNVMVSDYSGRVLRTETLDPSIHTKFFE